MQCELELYLEPVSVLNVAAELIEDDLDVADMPCEHEQVHKLSPYTTVAAILSPGRSTPSPRPQGTKMYL